MLDLDAKYLLSDGIALRGITSRFWALNTTDGSQYRLNEVSFFILNSLRTALTVYEVIDLVLKEYSVDRARATEDCKKVLQSAIEYGIVKEVST